MRKPTQATRSSPPRFHARALFPRAMHRQLSAAQRPTMSTASLRSTVTRKGKAVKQMVEEFLAEVRQPVHGADEIRCNAF